MRTPACPTYSTNNTHVTLCTLTADGPAPPLPPLDRLTVDTTRLPVTQPPPFPTLSSLFFSTTQVSHIKTAASALFRYKRPYHGETRNCPNLGPRSCFFVLRCLIPVSVVERCQQPVAQICVVDTCTCKASVA